MSNILADKISRLIAPIIEAIGFELWGCELLGSGRNTILRVYIDSENGITVDDCGKVSNQISGILDVEDLIHGQYSLEVSSPGIARKLFNVEQYKKYVNNMVKIKTNMSINDRRNFVGRIKSVSEDKLFIEVDEQDSKMVNVKIDNIDKAQLVNIEE